MHADGLLDILNVITRGLRQILVLAHTGDIAAPAGNGRQDGLCLVNDGGKREIVGLSPLTSYCVQTGISFI